jgi:hypothetical protein
VVLDDDKPRVVFFVSSYVREIETPRSTLVLVYTDVRPSDAERSVVVLVGLQRGARLLGCMVCVVVVARVWVCVCLRTGMILPWRA